MKIKCFTQAKSGCRCLLFRCIYSIYEWVTGVSWCNSEKSVIWGKVWSRLENIAWQNICCYTFFLFLEHCACVLTMKNISSQKKNSLLLPFWICNFSIWNFSAFSKYPYCIHSIARVTMSHICIVSNLSNFIQSIMFER